MWINERVAGVVPYYLSNCCHLPETICELSYLPYCLIDFSKPMHIQCLIGIVLRMFVSACTFCGASSCHVTNVLDVGLHCL